MAVGGEMGRAVQVFASAGEDGRGRNGAGYLITTDLVLTARHVVRDADGAIEVRQFGTEDWVAAAVVWSGAEDCEIVLLRLTETVGSVGPLGSARFGRLVGSQRADCEAVGFPWAQVEQREEPVRRAERIVGKVDPITGHQIAGASPALLTIHVDGSVPERRDDGGSPWAGMSGAALLCGELVIGVVVADPARFGPDRLLVAPIAEAAADTGFADLLTGGHKDHIPVMAVEADGLLEDPHRAPPSAHRDSLLVLLRPEYGIVPFRGRRHELEQLTQWCSTGQDISVGLLLGPGGTGKSRLAGELCRQLQDAPGMVSGFLRADADTTRIDSLTAADALLIVLDEAHERTEEIAELLHRLSVARPSSRIRILLVARQAGDWWTIRIPELLPDQGDARLALTPSLQLGLQQVDESDDGRREALAEAARAFASHLDRPAPQPTALDLTGSAFDTILFLHLAALTLAEGETEILKRGAVREDLVGFVLDREARYWASTAATHQLTLDPTERRRAVAVSTITTAGDEEQAVRALAAIPDLADKPQDLHRAARWLRHLYPPAVGSATAEPTPESAEGWFHALTPEPLQEALIATVLTELPTLPTRLLGDTTDEQAYSVLTTLTRTARAYPHAVQPLQEAIAAHFTSIWKTSLLAAQDVGDPLGPIIADVLAVNPQPELARQIEQALPKHSITLRELAVIATGQALDHTQNRSRGARRNAEKARLSTNLSIRLSGLGRHEEALSLVEEATHTYDRLAKRDRDAYLPYLAASLNNQSNCLSRLGRNREALTLMERAVPLYAELAGQQPEALQDLAMALNNQGSCLSRLGRAQQALPTFKDAAAIYLQLAEQQPEAFLGDIAMSLNNQASCLSDLGRHQAALTAATEAVGIRRELVELSPDAFLPSLAAALTNQSRAQYLLGRREQALEAIEEATDIYARLAKQRPEAFLSDFAGSLFKQSSCLSELNRPEDALRAVKEATDIYARLTGQRAEASLPDLVMALNNEAICLSGLHRHKQALAKIEEAIDRALPPAGSRPVLPDAGRGLMGTYMFICEESKHAPDKSTVQKLDALFSAAQAARAPR
jgi:tetratricopeptide (TPR) repeat protein